MKTLSNEELQTAIREAVTMHRHEHNNQSVSARLKIHIYELLDEQNRRAGERVNLELEPLDKVEFDARYRAQTGPSI